MPAETHQRTDGIDDATVVAVIATVLGLDDEPAPDVPLADVGVHDALDVLRLWAGVAEELAERTLGELDVDDVEVETFGDLVHLFAHAAGVRDVP